VTIAELSGLEGVPLRDLLILVRQMAERARKRRLLNPRGTMERDEALEAKVLYIRGKACLPQEWAGLAEPKWQSPGDVETAFLALYQALVRGLGPHSQRKA
jgi:hypothetical protein